MNSKEILTTLIQKALNRGYDFDGYYNEDFHIFRFVTQNEVRLFSDDGLSKGSFKVYEIIFSHDFARALWGDKLVDVLHPIMDNRRKGMIGWSEGLIKQRQLAWRARLQYMVLVENPIEFLEQFTKEETNDITNG